jgi:hypothetical protein
MSSSFIELLNLVQKEMTIYVVIPLSIIGVIGGCLNVIIFLSLKTFRESSCAFYLMMMSVFDIARFFSNVLPYIIRWGFEIDWGISSLFFCKIRLGMFCTCTLISMTCLCLSIIDQYIATCSHLRWQRWCNIKVAHRLTGLFIIIWIFHGIPYFIFENQIISPLTNETVCEVTNNIFNEYLTYGYYVTLTNVFPLITVIFGLMSYHNARHLNDRIVPLVRRELDKQLTVMVLVQVLISFCSSIPYSINNIFFIIDANHQSDPVFQAKENLAGSIATTFFIFSFSVRSR